MRYLNKIVFINSASIAYAEIAVDGNVHLIGTQGVGKSTLLRSILFFYNADTLKLGISREKKNFAEYYLPYANSYIIYEVARETGNFCVMAFKSQGKVCYRFIDSIYTKDIFIQEDGTVFDTFDKIRAGLDKRKIDYSRKIDRYEEYRDILYGNNEGKKELKKYAFLESRQYQNIPRTIQNVFLNSKLEAEFIKETIIHSLNENDIVIKLDTYQYQLKDFEEQLKDIRQFRQPAIQKQAIEIAELYIAIRQMEKEKTAYSMHLEYAYAEAVNLQPRLQNDLHVQIADQAALQLKQDDLKKRYDNKKDKLLAEISVLDDKLKTIKEKKAYYDKIKIELIAERVSQKTDVEQSAQHLQNEKALLSAQYLETTQKFAALLKELDNQFAETANISQQQQLELNTRLLQQKEDIRQQYQQLTDTIRKQHQQKLLEANLALEEAGTRLTAAEIKKAEIRHTPWYDEEIRQAKEEINSFKISVQTNENSVLTLKNNLVTIQKQWDLEDASRNDRKEREKEKTDTKINALKVQVAAIDKKLENTTGSLYEWLNNNQPEWKQNIGKVCDDNVLFNQHLQPSAAQETSSLYGIHINLEEIDRNVKTADDYEAERKQLNNQVEKLNNSFIKWKENWDSETEKLHRKILSLLKETKEQVKEKEYQLQQLQSRQQTAKLTLTDWVNKASADKENAIKNANDIIEAAANEKKQSKESVKKIEEEIDRQIRLKEKEKNLKITDVVAETQIAITNLADVLEVKKLLIENRKVEIKNQQQEALKASGADTKRLNEIDIHLSTLLIELQFIEKNRDKVVEYKKDKRELLDKTEDFKNNRQTLNQQLLNEESKFNNQHRNFLEELKTIKSGIQQLNLSLQKMQEDLDEYLLLTQTDWYVKNKVDQLGKPPVTKRCKDLVRQIKESHYAIIEKVNDVKEIINKFLSHFSSNNIFKFSAILIDKKQYLDFAEKLQQFIEDNRIAEFEKRVNERYASIIKLIGKETNELTSSEGEIQKIITRINNDFTHNNSIAVGVIQKIEMKMDESDNKVVQVLKLIQQFNADSNFELGAANLFNQHDSDSKNKKAVDLLKQLIKEIQNIRRDTITLSDSFEIKFRIIENQNDTGWVERLANVGSEGTDVLVKAMINIMLLNVFKEGASKRFKDFKLHCMMDEIGRLHPVNVRGILNFASARNIWLINGSPTENDALAYRHIYKLEKDSKSVTRVKRILTQHSVA